MKKGIDVSDNQGYIDWTKVKAAGIQFAILRSVVRNGNADLQLASNIIGCKNNDIPCDFYKYSYALTTNDAITEAKLTVETLKRYGVIPSKDTVIWMDVEDSSQIQLSTVTLTNIVQAFKREILASGFEFGLYMGKYLYENNEIDLNLLDEHTWIARYYNSYNIMPFITAPNETYRPTVKSGSLWGWQYTSSGRVNGINGNVDLNISYYDIKPTPLSPEYYQTPEFTLVDSLNKININSSYDYRKRIALLNGFTTYSGTAEQNLKLLQLLNAGQLKKLPL